MMRCPFCAEEIQDAAILCRFCGAQKVDSQWIPPGRPLEKVVARKGNFTLTTSGWLFLISGVVSAVTFSSEVPLWGAMRGGVLAMGYNLFFAALFLGIGIGLIMAKSWGYDLVLIGTAVYGLDRLVFVLDKDTRAAYLAASGLTKQVATLIDTSMFDEFLVLSTLITVACWCGFAFYVHLRRDYFKSSSGSSA